MVDNEFEYRKATLEDLEIIWNMNIADNSDDDRWSRWKYEYISYNKTGMAVTFVILCNGVPIGEGSLLVSPECKAVSNRKWLCDGFKIANVNALRIRKEYEGQGHMSKLMDKLEKYAVKVGYETLTIGVEEKEIRNRAIYDHWKYDKLLSTSDEDGEIVLYFAKNLK